jgi:predicted lipoprotein with Yx(FWY)xxD motif
VATTTTAAAAAATVKVATNATVGQPVLVDANGMSLYLFVPDGTSTTSKVPAAVTANWPALIAAGATNAGTGLDASKLTTAAQPDGNKQVAYNGHLLYLFVGDKAPGDAAGQGLGGNWYLVSAAGDRLG